MIAGLLALAAAVRLPYLFSIPQLTDETLESFWSYAIYRGQQLPLHNRTDFIGAWQNYLEAVGFALSGGSPLAPRALVCLLGVLGVGAGYLLARQALPRPAALLAGALLATSGVHAAFASHVAYSHSTTPLYLAAGLALLLRAARGSGPALAGAGLLLGLALQTHPTAAAFLPGAALFLLWKARPLLRTRWAALAAAAFLLGYANMLIYDLTTRFGAVSSRVPDDMLGSSLGEQRHLAVLAALLRLPAGALDLRPNDAAYLADPLVLAYAALTALGLVRLARGGNPLPGLVVLSGLAILPFLPADSSALDAPPHYGRYLAPLLPPLFVGLAAEVWWLIGAARRALRRRGVSKTTRTGLAVATCCLLSALPLLHLARFYDQNLQMGRTNDRFFAVLGTVEAQRRDGEAVLLDRALGMENTGGGGTALRALRYLLTLRGVPIVEDQVSPASLRAGDAPPIGLVVLTRRTYQAVGSELPLEPLGRQAGLAPPNPYGIYRVGRTDGR